MRPLKNSIHNMNINLDTGMKHSMPRERHSSLLTPEQCHFTRYPKHEQNSQSLTVKLSTYRANDHTFSYSVISRYSFT